MPILPAGQRRYFFQKNLHYLFSYDLAFDEDACVAAVGGLELSLSHWSRPVANADPDPEASFQTGLVYHVLDEPSVQGNDAITGTVTKKRVTAFVPFASKEGYLEGAITIETHDGGILESKYRGSMTLGPLGQRQFDVWEGQEHRTRLRAFTAPRFETAYEKYRWLSNLQCAGFGRFDLVNGKVKTGTFDIYAVA